MVDFVINEVYPKGEAYPIIAHFQNGYPADDFDTQECQVLEHIGNGKKCIASEINKILYVGDECDDALGKTLILARDRLSGKVRIIEVGNAELRPVMKSVIENPELETSYVELGKKFGSKRHKKKLEQSEKLKVNAEVVMEQLKDVSQNVTVDQLDLSAFNNSGSEDFYIPPINREATAVEDVYSLDSILSPQQYEVIFSEIDSCEYISDLFPLVKEMYSQKWSKEKTVLAVFASTLLTLNSKTMKQMIIKKFVACPYSQTLDKLVLKEFFTYNGNSRLRPVPYKDKTLCYAIVFLLLINNYRFDLESFCKHTKTIEKTAITKIHMTGAWTVKEGKNRVAVLKIPLNKAGFTHSKRKSALLIK